MKRPCCDDGAADLAVRAPNLERVDGTIRVPRLTGAISGAVVPSRKGRRSSMRTRLSGKDKHVVHIAHVNPRALRDNLVSAAP